MTTLTEQIDSEARKPASVSNDGVTVAKRSLSELIAADRYARDVAATAATPATMLRGMCAKIVAPGGH